MKVIDLLNKIANGEEVPKEIKYNGRIYNYENNDYFDSDYGYLFDRYNVSGILNDEVEVIDEEKKIPEKICTNRIINTKDILEFEIIQNKINAEYTYALNGVIDYLKSKGE